MSLLQMSVSGAVLVVVIAAVRVLMLHRLPKRVFVLLWSVVLLRLLVPFSIPARTSVYSFVQEQVPADVSEMLPAGGFLPAEAVRTPQEGPDGDRAEAQMGNAFPAPAVQTLVWLAGAAACAVFFLICFVRCRREFGMSLPVENAFAVHWREEHRRWRSIQLRQSDRITAPLTYGIFRPVILVPKRTDWEEKEQVSCVLLHEYIHICRLDALRKLFAAAALCIHWFNPFVWLMYVLINKDIELSCDEAVVQRLDGDGRVLYAQTLIAMEERKSGLLPLFSSFSRNAMEERMKEIMRAKKITAGITIASAVLVAVVAGVFATSAKADSAGNAAVQVPDGSRTQEDAAAEEPPKAVDKTAASGERLVYVESFDGMTLTFDEVEWVMVPGARASELGISVDDAPSGFNVFNETVLSEALPMAADCVCTVLDWTGNYRSMKVTPEELKKIFAEREGTPIPYQITVEQGRIVAIVEHYVP